MPTRTAMYRRAGIVPRQHHRLGAHPSQVAPRALLVQPYTHALGRTSQPTPQTPQHRPASPRLRTRGGLPPPRLRAAGGGSTAVTGSWLRICRFHTVFAHTCHSVSTMVARSCDLRARTCPAGNPAICEVGEGGSCCRGRREQRRSKLPVRPIFQWFHCHSLQ